MIFRIILRRNKKRKLEVDLARAAVGNAARGRYDAALNRYKIFLTYFGKGSSQGCVEESPLNCFSGLLCRRKKRFKSFLPKYFNSEWSFAHFHFPNKRTISVFTKDK